MKPECQILPSVGTEVPHCFFNVELTCQISPLVGTEVRIFLYAELECQILRLVKTEVPTFSWRGTGVQSQCSDLGLAAFFPSLELECGTGVRSEFGIPVPVKGCVISAISHKLQAAGEPITGQLLSVSMLGNGAAIEKTVLYFLTTPEGQWERLQVVSSRCQAVLEKMNWFTAFSGPLAGQQVASVGSFLTKSGKRGKHANSYVASWGDGSVPGVSKQSFSKQRLRQQRGGKGYVSTKAVFKRVFKYVS